MNTKHLLVTILAVILSLVSADFMSAQNFHYRKGWEYANIDWERSAFSEWEDGMAAGEMSSTIMVAACYMREYGVGRNVSKGVSIMENLASKNIDVALFAANFWFPILDGDPFFDYSPHAGGQYNMWSMFQWWQEKDLRATNFGLDANYAKVIKFSKMYLAKVSSGYGANLAKEMIGYCYENGGNGVSKDLTKALEYYSGLNRFYELATKLIESTGTIEEMEQEVSKLKPYIKDEDVLSSLDSKSWTAGTYDYTDREREFLGAYIGRYSADAEKGVEDWWTLNNPLGMGNPENFNTEYKRVPQFWQTVILKKFTDLFNGIKEITGSESLKKLWIACPDSLQGLSEEIGRYYIDRKIKEIRGADNFEKRFHDLTELRHSSIINNIPASEHRVDEELKITNFAWQIAYICSLIDENTPGCWMWHPDVSVPVEFQNNNICYGAFYRDESRNKLKAIKKNLQAVYNLINSKQHICSEYNYTIDVVSLLDYENIMKYESNIDSSVQRQKLIKLINTIQNSKTTPNDIASNIITIENNVKKLNQYFDFISLLEKEDNKTITPEDYSSYLEKYPDAYYKQYCIDGYAMAKADTFALDTPKDEIKKLLDSGITKGAAKYVKTVTKKSYLKSKLL